VQNEINVNYGGPPRIGRRAQYHPRGKKQQKFLFIPPSKPCPVYFKAAEDGFQKTTALFQRPDAGEPWPPKMVIPLQLLALDPRFGYPSGYGSRPAMNPGKPDWQDPANRRKWIE
jgi:hypothetical protein